MTTKRGARSTKAAASTRVREVTRALLTRWPLPEAQGGKEGRGSVLIIGGSTRVPGAAILAGEAALRAGCGRLQIATAKEPAASVASLLPEASVVALSTGREGELAASGIRALGPPLEQADAIVVGPGMARGALVQSLFGRIAREEGEPRMIIDAAAIQALRPSRKSSPWIITPHAGEMAKLLGVARGQVERDPLGAARDASAAFGVIVVMKGPETFVVRSDGLSFVDRFGCPGLGTSGSGDALAGIIGGLAARGAEPMQAAIWGVHLHAAAGAVLARTRGPLGFLARELLLEVPPLMARLDARRRRLGG